MQKVAIKSKLELIRLFWSSTICNTYAMNTQDCFAIARNDIKFVIASRSEAIYLNVSKMYKLNNNNFEIR